MFNVIKKSAAFNVEDYGAGDTLYVADTTTEYFEAKLPPVARCEGWVVSFFVTKGGNSLGVRTTGTEKIDGIQGDYVWTGGLKKTVTLVSDGASWIVQSNVGFVAPD